jgi:AcrR family transcriptional regulator
VSSSRSDRPSPRRYHHGDLRNALIDAAVDLIAERGVRDFSLAEVGRRVGVSAAAPYRHFADREDLLVAVAVRALTAFGETVVAQVPADLPPGDRLPAVASAYVRFAGSQRTLFESIFATGIDKAKHPEVHEAEAPIDAMVEHCVEQLCPGDPGAAQSLADALAATAHGYATRLLDGMYAADPDPVGTASRKAAGAVRALIRGRDSFASA